MISGSPSAAGSFLFRLIAADETGGQTGQPCALIVNRGPLSVSGCPLPGATAGIPYSQTLAPTGGTEPYLWTHAGKLPAGMSLSPRGLVSGTPGEPGVFPFQVTVIDGGMRRATQSCTLAVSAPQLELATSCPLPVARLGETYSNQFAATGGAPPYRYDFYGYLPDGLRVSRDGTIFGTPTSLGAMAFLVNLIDSNSESKAKICSIE